jgi:hypothetical protein
MVTVCTVQSAIFKEVQTQHFQTEIQVVLVTYLSLQNLPLNNIFIHQSSYNKLHIISTTGIKQVSTVNPFSGSTIISH